MVIFLLTLRLSFASVRIPKVKGHADDEMVRLGETYVRLSCR